MSRSRVPPPGRALERTLARVAARAWRVEFDPALPKRVEHAVRQRDRARVTLPSAGVVMAAVLLALGAWLLGPARSDARGPDRAGEVPVALDGNPPLLPPPATERAP